MLVDVLDGEATIVGEGECVGVGVSESCGIFVGEMVGFGVKVNAAVVILEG
jgi:hypothetical protein